MGAQPRQPAAVADLELALTTTSPRRRAPAVGGTWQPAPAAARGPARLLPGLLLAVTGGGFGLLAVVPGAAPETAPTAVHALADTVALPVVLPDTDLERASRGRAPLPPETPPTAAPTAASTAASTAAPAAAPAPPPVLPGCDGVRPDLRRFANGRLPDRVLCEIPGTGERLRADAAVAFVRLARAYEQALGTPLCLTDGYRPLAEQKLLRRTKPRLAARPGASDHGWGTAVDLSCGVQSFRTGAHAWMAAHGPEHGWHLPRWARRGGGKPEPWHWEFDDGTRHPSAPG